MYSTLPKGDMFKVESSISTWSGCPKKSVCREHSHFVAWRYHSLLIFIKQNVQLVVASFYTGIAGINECPYRNNALIGYLIGGGILLAITVLFRSVPSISTIGKNHNWCHSRNSSSCSGGICAMEVNKSSLSYTNVQWR